ncbi:MAG: DUF5688 family protein, partial [Eubacteriales bacterium]|nr:DUF5688 family protein [Eubacteriales bacterium]
MQENKIMNIKDAPQKVQEVAKLMETKEGILYHVQYGIVNKRWSKDFIDKIPHKSIQDLAIIYNVVFDAEGEIISGRITNELLKLRGITVEELVKAAWLNSPDVEVQSMEAVMREMCKEMGVPYEAHPDAPRQFVITNEKKCRGA